MTARSLVLCFACVLVVSSFPLDPGVVPESSESDSSSGTAEPETTEPDALPGAIESDASYLVTVDGDASVAPVVGSFDTGVAAARDSFYFALNDARAKCGMDLIAQPGTLEHVRTVLTSLVGILIESEYVAADSTRYFAKQYSPDARGVWETISLTPDPCDASLRLSMGQTEVAQINDAGLPWKASIYEPVYGKPLLPGKAFAGKRLKRLPVFGDRHRALVPSLEYPTDFSLVDIYPGEQQCVSFFKPRYQSGGTCTFYASAAVFASSLCLNSGRAPVGNVLVSVQQSVDCCGCGDYTNGANPGSVASWFTSGTPVCNDMDDPVLGVTSTCPSNCSGGLSYTGAGMTSVYSFGNTLGEWYQASLIMNGPLSITLNLFTEYQYYSGGVYSPSAGAVVWGTHSVALVGWGVDAGVPYWTIQNSWGSGWGEGGFGRILRGSDVMGIETYEAYALDVPGTTACPNSPCANGSTVLADCSCSCANTFLTGPTCSTCSAVCNNGGVMDSLCSVCACVPGFSGQLCQYGIKLSQTASKIGDGSRIRVTWAYNSSTQNYPPPGQSLIGLYKAGVVSAYGYSAGTKYCSISTGANCADSGAVYITPPTTAGVYLIYSCNYVYGPYPGLYTIDSGYNLYLGTYTVLLANASSADVTSASAANGPVAYFTATQASQAAASAASSAAMQARLALRGNISAQLQAVPAPSLTITNLMPGNKIWTGGQTQVCYYVPSYMNTPQKSVQAYYGNLNTLFAGKVIASGDGDLGPDNQGCVIVVINMAPVTITTLFGLGYPTGSSTLLANTGPFTYNRVDLLWSTHSTASGQIKLVLTWQMYFGNVSRTDVVRLVNPNGTLYSWVYAQTGSQTVPTGALKTSGVNSVTLYIKVANSVRGVYTAYFHPANTTLYARQAPANSWNWTSFWP